MAALIPHLQPNVQFPMELLSAQVATGDLDGALAYKGLPIDSDESRRVHWPAYVDGHA
jgi:hypothetical protein